METSRSIDLALNGLTGPSRREQQSWSDSVMEGRSIRIERKLRESGPRPVIDLRAHTHGEGG